MSGSEWQLVLTGLKEGGCFSGRSVWKGHTWPHLFAPAMILPPRPRPTTACPGRWAYMMVDEAHRLKNDESALYKVRAALRMLRVCAGLLDGVVAVCRAGRGCLDRGYAVPLLHPEFEAPFPPKLTPQCGLRAPHPAPAPAPHPAPFACLLPLPPSPASCPCPCRSLSSGASRASCW